MLSRSRFHLSLLLLALMWPLRTLAEDGGQQQGGYDNYQAANNNYDNNNGADDFDYQDYANQYVYDNVQEVDDNIDYWTSFHIRAKRCVVYKDVDVVVFEVFGSGDQCMDASTALVGIYYTPVPYYMQGYLDEVAQKMEDLGMDDYVEPDVAQYQYCTAKEVNGEIYYLQIGCADDTTQSVAVNVYSDNTCEKRAPNNHGIDDANMDISDIQIPFKKCKACVNWVNKEDDQIDDQFYEKRQMLAPLCSTAWQYKEKCGQRCQMIGRKDEQESWNRSDLTLLIVLSSFAAVVGIVIWRKRTKLPNKDALLETAAMNAVGLNSAHLVGIAILILVVIAIFALLALKNVVFALLLIIDVVLFGYLMKLTFDSSKAEPVIGPDGQVILKADSDDSDDGSRESSVRPDNNPNGTYMLPTLT